MDSYAEARKKDRSKDDIIGEKRQEKSLREFKGVLSDLVYLLRKSSGVETCYLYWVNRSRKQFVLETKSTELSNVMFQDRMAFRSHFLDRFKDISDPVGLTLGDEVGADELVHYYEEIPVRDIVLLPFSNNGETVAITVLESSELALTEEKSEVLHSYVDALRNMLNTYLEISDLYENQNEWIDYEDSLEKLNVRSHRADLICKMVEHLQGYLQEGGVSFLAQGMQGWNILLNAAGAKGVPPVGMPMEKRTMAYEALQKGSPEFAIHFNDNPKRVSPREFRTEGASLAIPLMFHDRRQGLVLISDKNPLLFKESAKHKFINIVRQTGLRILANDPQIDISEPFLNNQFDAFIPDIWERIVENELQSLDGGQQRYHTWFGMLTLSNLAALRTQLRIEDLDHMQRDLVNLFNPSRYGTSGIIGGHADYVYTFLIQSRDEDAVQQWTRQLKQRLEDPVELTNGVQVETSIKVGFTRLNKDQNDTYEVLSQAKSALSQAMKSGEDA